MNCHTISPLEVVSLLMARQQPSPKFTHLRIKGGKFDADNLRTENGDVTTVIESLLDHIPSLRDLDLDDFGSISGSGLYQLLNRVPRFVYRQRNHPSSEISLFVVESGRAGGAPYLLLSLR